MDRCCGPDVPKDSVFACILDSHGEKVIEQRFRTQTGELTEELIKGSSVPGEVIQQMRQYSRQYRRLTGSKARVEQHMDSPLSTVN